MASSLLLDTCAAIRAVEGSSMAGAALLRALNQATSRGEAPDLLIASSFLPGSALRDPADRIIAATAREYGCTLVTRDRLLLAYAEQGHMQALAC